MGDTPNEFTDSFNPTVPPVNAEGDGQVGDVAELSMEDLYQLGVDNDKLKEETKELTLKQGTWTTVPEFKFKVFKAKIKATGHERLFVRLWGKVTMGQDSGNLSYRISNERFNKMDRDTGADTGKPDIAYRLYLNANSAFKTAHGREASNFGEIINYLANYPVRLRSMPTDEGESIVVNITPVRPQA